MFFYKVSRARSTFDVVLDPTMDGFDLKYYQKPEDFAGPDFEALEMLQDIDGTEFARHPLTESEGGLLILEELAPKLRDYLNEHGCIVAERRVISPHNSYILMRVFNLYNDNPNAPMFRLWRSPTLRELSVSQYASTEFADWLKENFDASGLRFIDVQREEPYERLPKNTSSL